MQKDVKRNLTKDFAAILTNLIKIKIKTICLFEYVVFPPQDAKRFGG